MAVVAKDRIYVGDSYKVSYECIETADEDENRFTFTSAPVNPVSAIAKLWNVTTQEFIELGGPGVDEATATVVGNVITYILPGANTGTFGDYKLFVTATFADGQIKSEMSPLKILTRA